ncbi:MAG: polysaccharide biosynthesis protein [Oscillospiraceae bacterium]|nr:polysaccharide biosynthesis protein [Oscillospiraceae bacterium]
MKKRDFSLSIMIVLTFFGQLLSLVQSSRVARIFGVSVEMDAYRLATSIFAFFFGLFSAGITTMLVPAYAKKNKRQANVFLTVSFSFLLLSSVIIILFRTPIISTITHQNAVLVQTAAKLVILVATLELFKALSTVSTAYFHCIGNHNIGKILGLFTQTALVLYILFARNITIFSYTWALWILALISFLLHWTIADRKGMGFRIDFRSAADPEVQTILYAFLPILLSEGIDKLASFVDSMIAANLETGMITILSYSQMIVTMINSLLIVNLFSHEYPRIVANIQEDKSQKLFWDKTIVFHTIVCLVFVAFVAGGKQAVEFLYLNPKFDQQAVNMLFTGAILYLFGQQLNVIRDLIYRYFYAMQETKVTARNSILVNIVNIIVSLILVFTIGFYGIILGTVVASLVSLIVMFVQFNKCFGFPEQIKSYIKKYFVNLLCAGIAILGTLLLRQILPDTIPLLLDLFLDVCIASVFYLVMEYLLNRTAVFQTLELFFGKRA